MARTRYVVVGAGLAGSATAWQLAKRGCDVTLLEAFSLSHAWGSSHGSARIIRRAYADRFYTELTGEAWADWAELEHESAAQLVTRTGGLDFGRDRDLAGVVRAQDQAGVPHARYAADEARERWPQFAFDSEVLHHPDAGVVDVGLAVLTACRQAEQHGAAVRTGWPVAAVQQRGSSYVLSSAAGQPPVAADVVVVTAGPWLGDLLPFLPVEPALLPPLEVTRQQVFHFAARDSGPWPVFLDHDREFHYGLPGGADVGPGQIKVGEHDRGPRTRARPTGSGSRGAGNDGAGSCGAGSSGAGTAGPTADTDAETRARVVDYVSRRIPGLVPSPHSEATCLYTNTPTEDFVLDRTGGVVVVSPCSGHGAKFAPTIGRIAADLATGARSRTLPRFAFVGSGRAASPLASAASPSSR